MSETPVLDSKQHEPTAIHLRDYEVPTYLIDEIDLEFELNDEVTMVKSQMRVRHNRLSTNNSRNLVLSGEELTLVAIKLDGKILTKSQYQITEHSLTINDAPDNFELEIMTSIQPQKNTALSGLYRSSNTYCTQCEAEGFRRITYFLDRPDVLARYTTKITADYKRYPHLLSNGNPIATGQLDDGRHWVKWEDPFKKPSYLFALVAGDFDMIEDNFKTQSGRDITLRIYVDKGYAEQSHHAMYSLMEAMRWDEVTYGREYDLDIYMIVAIGDFNMGAMENKGLNIFNTKYVLAKPETATDSDYINILSVIGHEYFHNWSGNRVTCRDWFQLSLKEGLTIFRDQSFSEDLLSRSVMRIQDVIALREGQFPEDAGPLAHPVRPDSYIEINNFYTTTIYNKGAEVLRMLQTILGITLFRKGMDLYFARHDGQAVTIEDFVKTMEDVSGINLRQFRLWYSQAGTPIVSVEEDYDAKKQIYRLTLHQKTNATPGALIKKSQFIPVKMGLLDQSGSPIPLHLGEEVVAEEKVLHLTESTQIFEFKQVNTRPILSILRNFSAPVKLNYAASDSDLQFLFKHDQDPFNRWEAGQNYALRVILNLVQDIQHNKPLRMSHELPDMFDYILQHEANDNYFLAEMLTLPSEKYISEQMQVVDVTAIHTAREFVVNELAKQLQTLLLETYNKHRVVAGEYKFNLEQIGRRQLQNRCLMYLMQLPKFADLGMQQFEASYNSNMTDAQSALAALANLDSPLREKALELFYTTWKHDALVVDKWLAIQAASKLPNTLQTVRKLMRHPAFDIKNPNKVYALIGTFGQRNPSSFHAEDGEGYAFLREVVHKLDKLNPQVAARMVNPLTTWKRYDKERQDLMREQLELLLQDKKMSTDLYELVSKSVQA